MIVKKNDFIELEFTGFADGQVFDTTIKKEAEKINLKIEEKPLIVCIGHEMLVKGFDEALQDKEIEKEYKITLSPEQSFGARNKNLIKIVPLRVFREKNISPYPGAVLNLDGMLAKILTVSGGRVITDFNNPLAGKEIEYRFKIKRKVTDDKEKIDALQDFFFRQRFDFEIKEKKVIFKEAKLEPLVGMFKDKFKEMTGLDFEAEKSVSNTEK